MQYKRNEGFRVGKIIDMRGQQKKKEKKIF